jgi:hypothetical protein
VNSINPSCSLDMSWSTLSFNAEKISLVSRICRPKLAIFNVTSPNSSCSDSLPESSSLVPKLTLSKLRLISFSGPRAMLEIIAASNNEAKIDAIEKYRACMSRGVSSFLRKTVETPIRIVPKGSLFNCSG